MQIKFKKAFFPDEPKELLQAELLEVWKNNIEKYQVKFISAATVNFADYDIIEYPDQDKLCSDLIKNNIQEAKENPKQFIESLAGKLRIMELTITAEVC